MQFVNNYSMLITVVFLSVLVGFFLFRDGIRPYDLVIFILILILEVGVWLALLPKQSDAQVRAGYQEQIGQGTPVLLELQSPF